MTNPQSLYPLKPKIIGNTIVHDKIKRDINNPAKNFEKII
tara:strand:+ start:909 stop:1028 length:120 start_codon:yes stop_codon:yes gene_type:complete